MHRYNENKISVINDLKSVLESSNSQAMNENEVVKALTMCKDHLRKSHSTVCVNLPNANRGSKSIVEALSRIDPTEYGKNSSQSKTISFLIIATPYSLVVFD